MAVVSTAICMIHGRWPMDQSLTGELSRHWILTRFQAKSLTSFRPAMRFGNPGHLCRHW
jgi:hypothetical protein